MTLGLGASFATSAASFAGRTNYATGHFPVSLAIGDLSGDGKPDMVTANSEAKTISALANTGDGEFQPKLDFSFQTAFHESR